MKRKRKGEGLGRGDGLQTASWTSAKGRNLQNPTEALAGEPGPRKGREAVVGAGSPPDHSCKRGRDGPYKRGRDGPYKRGAPSSLPPPLSSARRHTTKSAAFWRGKAADPRKSSEPYTGGTERLPVFTTDRRGKGPGPAMRSSSMTRKGKLGRPGRRQCQRTKELGRSGKPGAKRED